MRHTDRFLIVLVLLLLIVGSVSAQDGDSLFQPLSDTPIFTHGATDWEANFAYTDPGAVLYHDGQFHMLRNAFPRWPARVSMAYATSTDGVTWTEMSDEPVLTTPDVPFARTAALASSLLVEDDGTWVLYFYTWNTLDWNKGNGSIGRATADSPLGPWTVDAEPVLLPGNEGSWDEQMVNAPAVVHTDDGYFMYYTGYSQLGLSSGKIGLATSDDGVNWIKHDDPATTDDPFAESDPILTATEAWEGRYLTQPRVLLTPDGWIMLYRAFNNASDVVLGVADSADGITWTKHNAPVMRPTAVPEQVAMWYTATAYADGVYYLFAELSKTAGSAITDIFALAYAGSLPPEG